MDSVIKYCASCDEGFAKSFDVCPNCGSELQAFRMQAIDDGRSEAVSEAADQGSYSVTVIAEKNVGRRNALFGGAFVFLVLVLVTGLVVNLFSKDLDIGSINGDVLSPVMIDDLAQPVEKAPKVKKDKGKGGGGGGNEDPIPASQGDRAPMRTDPQFAPSVSMNRLTNPTIPIQMAIKGPINEKLDTARYGVKLGGDTPSDGPGSNGGQGPGRNGGQGPGDGPGAGPGSRGG
ncbi:MAG TPA: hypothetical protein VL501_01290, partial [Pyrinomonadaceae bacterium]|nr:hypothetical protein [Pyrinomonadaceae bacterium]